MAYNRKDEIRRHDSMFTAAFVASWLVNLALCVLVLFVLINAFVAPVTPEFGTTTSMCIFVLLFGLFTASILVYRASKSYVVAVLTIVFAFLCALLTAITLFSNDYIVEAVRFRDDPVLWVERHRWLPIAFLVAFLPVFIIQIFNVNRYANLWGQTGDPAVDHLRKAETEAEHTETTRIA
ncbi:hypothetical protein AAVH_02635 [Aphelenchoides avenae]|nr:hypothetical protein AAVH_02635 [Aphelenchus avenae]